MNDSTHAADDQAIDQILTFWFIDDASGRMDLPQIDRWFKGGQALDPLITERFSRILQQARQGHLEHWLQTARGTLALIVLLDQFNRHIHRGSADAFALDSQALEACRHGLHQGFTEHLPVTHKVFYYLPLEHDESHTSQEQSLELFEALHTSAPEELKPFTEATLDSAKQHKDIIDQFGRYPYRNAVLNRISTDAELVWLENNSESFGQ